VSNNLTRRVNHRHIFIVARIKPAPENPPRTFSKDGRMAKTMGKPNPNRRFRTIAQAILQTLHPSNT
jgi:hypothetical protein